MFLNEFIKVCVTGFSIIACFMFYELSTVFCFGQLSLYLSFDSYLVAWRPSMISSFCWIIADVCAAYFLEVKELNCKMSFELALSEAFIQV